MKPTLILTCAIAFVLSACDFVETAKNPPPAASSQASYWSTR